MWFHLSGEQFVPENVVITGRLWLCACLEA